MSKAREVKLILTSTEVGSGTPQDVSRIQFELWARDGRFIASYDPCGGPNNTPKISASPDMAKL